MSGKALESDLPTRTAVAPPSAPSARQVAIEERRRLVAESLQVGNPRNSSRDLPAHADPRLECQVELAVDDIRPYENNPRRAGNARFAEIKESIRASGIRNPLTVTRRPGESHFIVEAGGNTRLMAVQQLWAETRDPRFRKLLVLFRPWRSESHVLSSHLIENEQRGEMTFWDKATGVVALKSRLEAEMGNVLSLRQLEGELTSLGLSVNTATLAHYLFATERLRTLGERCPDLSGLDVKTMQPRLNAMKRHAQSRASRTEEELYASVFEPVFRQFANEYPRTRSFSAAAVCEACEEALARHLGEPVAQLRHVLDSSSRSSRAGAEPCVPTPIAPPAARSAPDDTSVSTANSSPSHQVDRLQPGTAHPAIPGGHTPTEQLIEQVRVFAAMAGIADCVHLQPAAPLGYYLETLPIADLGLPARRRAWSLLAGISGQLDNTAPTQQLDATFLCWLVDADDEAASAFWNILSLVRKSRGAGRRPPVANYSPPAPGHA
ncbi:MAG: hypothetical protein EPO20_22635 [Betaproteobacteria bacterium]|nr:MAG: hypothetical protein EPO20_22635 [Betaproteobacteria bacterium]